MGDGSALINAYFSEMSWDEGLLNASGPIFEFFLEVGTFPFLLCDGGRADLL